MGEFRYINPDTVAQRHRTRTPNVPPRQVTQRSPQLRNVEAVLSLGDVRYVTYRNGLYRIPPVPFKLGQRVLDAQMRWLHHAKQVAMTGQQTPSDAFYKETAVLVRLLWKHIRPAGKINRLLWRLHLLRNPFRHASEADVQALTNFFSQGRMMSSVRVTSETGT